MNELVALRKKYDTVVEYTVMLTAERDNLQNRVDELQGEVSKEKSRRRDEGERQISLLL